jgi:DNA-binding NtrC family response regulator
MAQMNNSVVKILLADDQPANLDVLGDLLESQGYDVLLTPNGKLALRTATRALPDLILLDVMMPDMDGFETCQALKANADTASIPVIFITALTAESDVVQGFEVGGVDFITKPFNDKEVISRVETHLRISRLTRELASKNDELNEKNRELESEIRQRQKLKGHLSLISETEHWGLEGFIGESPMIKKIFDDVKLMQENVGTSVLVTGENGTGKELVARAIHYGSPRRDAPFVPINCSAIPGELVESTLFGHERGAFTGANADRAGCFELAHEGTLFLDEIGDMPLEAQGKLLRVLEDGEVWRVGASKGKRVEVRVLAATNADLSAKIDNREFRQDLFYRLARFTVDVPSLRERKEDIPLLAEHFVSTLAPEMGRDVPRLNQDAIDLLLDYAFPGNVRELKNLIERALIESNGAEVGGEHLHFVGRTSGGADVADGDLAKALPFDLDEAALKAESLVLDLALEKAGGNLTEAARILGTTRNRAYRIVNQRRKE